MLSILSHQATKLSAPLANHSLKTIVRDANLEPIQPLYIQVLVYMTLSILDECVMLVLDIYLMNITHKFILIKGMHLLHLVKETCPYNHMLQ